MKTKAVLMGDYGQTVKPLDPDVQKKVIGDAIPKPTGRLTTVPELDKLEKK